MPDDTATTLGRILDCKPWEVVAHVEELALERNHLRRIVKSDQRSSDLIRDLILLGSSHPIAKRERLRIATEIAPNTGRFRTAVLAALRRGKGWSLTEQEYLTLASSPCVDCGSPTGNGIGLDRLNNQRGYESANVEPCCGPCNMLRQQTRSRKPRTRPT